MHCIYVAGNVVTLSYLIYKWIMALFLIANQILSFILFFLDSSGHPGRAGKYWLFATHWGFILIVVAFNLDAILVLARYIIQVRLSQIVINNTHQAQIKKLEIL